MKRYETETFKIVNIIESSFLVFVCVVDELQDGWAYLADTGYVVVFGQNHLESHNEKIFFRSHRTEPAILCNYRRGQCFAKNAARMNRTTCNATHINIRLVWAGMGRPDNWLGISFAMRCPTHQTKRANSIIIKSEFLRSPNRESSPPLRTIRWICVCVCFAMLEWFLVRLNSSWTSELVFVAC